MTAARALLLAAVLACLLPGCDELAPFQIDTTSLPDGTVGTPYSARVRTSGGRGRVTVRFLDGQLPPGVGMRQVERDGEFYGTPTRAGDFQFTVEARDSLDDGGPASVVTFGYAIAVRQDRASGLKREPRPEARLVE